MKCPKCEIDNPEGSSFCRGCGQSLQTELICSRCQHINIPGSKFCNKCGQLLGTVQAPQPTPISPSPSVPTSFANGRYQVKKFLGEGGKKKVYLAHDILDLSGDTQQQVVLGDLTKPGQSPVAYLGGFQLLMDITSDLPKLFQTFATSPSVPGASVQGIVDELYRVSIRLSPPEIE